MINYLFELTAVHVVLMLGYWVFLRRETQYALKRFYLLSAVVLALTVPLLKLPKLFTTEEPVVTAPDHILSTDPVTVTPVAHFSLWSAEVFIWLYAAVIAVLLFRFIYSLRSIVRITRQSSWQHVEGIRVYRGRQISGSFSFFRWIFVAEEIGQDSAAYEFILAHERAHAHLGHTFDIIVLRLFAVFVWWLPTGWLGLAEIKRIHEYQADAEVLQSYNIDAYSAVLISATLKQNGLSLASSFYDGQILKRINMMTQQTKKVSLFKLGALTVICLSLVLVLACTEDKSPDQPTTEIFTLVEKMPEFPGGVGAFNKKIMKEITYPSGARENGIEGRVNVQFVIDKDGSLSDVKALNSLADCDHEAERVISSMPAFTPGTQQGRPVRVRMVIPIVFQLENKDSGNRNGVIIVEPLQPLNAKLKVDARYSDGQWTGTVYDEDGGPLPGVNLIVEGTTSGTVSNLDGQFKLAADEGQDVVLSFVGYDFVKLHETK